MIPANSNERIPSGKPVPLANRVTERIRHYFNQHPEVSREEFLLEALRREWNSARAAGRSRVQQMVHHSTTTDRRRHPNARLVGQTPGGAPLRAARSVAQASTIPPWQTPSTVAGLLAPADRE